MGWSASYVSTYASSSTLTACFRATLLIFDAQDRVIGACVGPPDAAQWPDVHRRAFEKLSAEAAHAHFARKERIHRRGRFPAINVGISMGMGPSDPSNLDLGKHAAMVERLLADPDINRMANHASGAQFPCLKWTWITSSANVKLSCASFFQLLRSKGRPLL